MYLLKRNAVAVDCEQAAELSTCEHYGCEVSLVHREDAESHGLSSLKGGYIEDYTGKYCGGY